MIWPVPLLSFTDHSHWFSSTPAHVTNPDGYVSFCWHQSGAAALASVCERIASEKGRRVNILIPGYFCGQSLRYLRSLPVQLNFYLLSKDLLPDYENIRRLDESIDVFVHVHFFGRVDGQQKSRLLANDLGAVLIEDCSHIISPLLASKWYGDYLIFSPHKYFPLPKVGLLISRFTLSDQGVKLNVTPTLVWLLRQIARRMFYKKKISNWGCIWSDTISQHQELGPSFLTSRAAISFITEFESSAIARRVNTNRLLVKLETVPKWRELYSFNETSVPYLVGMLCDTPALAAHRFKILNRKFTCDSIAMCRFG